MQKLLSLTFFSLLLFSVVFCEVSGDTLLNSYNAPVRSIDQVSADGLSVDGRDYLTQLKYTRIALLVCIILIISLCIYTLRRILLTDKQNDVIFKQKQEVEKQRNLAAIKQSEAEQAHNVAEHLKYLTELKNAEIMSITKQTQNLQNMLFSNVNKVKEFYEESMVIYQLENFISSLLYWVQTKGALTVFVIADAKIKGVNGAILSISCVNALNQYVHENDITTPKETILAIQAVLEETVMSNLGLKPTNIEFSICVINETTQLLHYTGKANFVSIYRFATDTWEDQLFEFKSKNNTNKISQVPVFHGDAIYMMNSDMRQYLLQVRSHKVEVNHGNEKDKRSTLFLSKNLNEQKNMLEGLMETEEFIQWKTSDLCLLVLRISNSKQHPFTTRELEVINYIAQGLNSKEIAEKMFVSKHTVDTHRRKILKKIDAKNSAEVIRYCREIRVLI